MVVVKCDSCGGRVASKAGSPACVFCGSSVEVEQDAEEQVEAPEGWIDFTVDESAAGGSFSEFASSSFWYPSAIRSATVKLQPVLLPAWSWSGELETHWTGLVRAHTRSGKQPVAGADRARFDQVLIPSSATLTVRELTGLGAYDESALQMLTGDASQPMEVSELTRTAARQQAVDEMVRRHEEAIVSERSLKECHVAALPHGLSGRPVLVPVWVGVYEHKGISYRVLVQGQTGAVVGEAPTDWLKVLMVTFGVVFLVAGLIGLLVSVLG